MNRTRPRSSTVAAVAVAASALLVLTACSTPPARYAVPADVTKTASLRLSFEDTYESYPYVVRLSPTNYCEHAKTALPPDPPSLFDGVEASRASPAAVPAEQPFRLWIYRRIGDRSCAAAVDASLKAGGRYVIRGDYTTQADSRFGASVQYPATCRFTLEEEGTGAVVWAIGRPTWHGIHAPHAVCDARNPERKDVFVGDTVTR